MKRTPLSRRTPLQRQRIREGQAEHESRRQGLAPRSNKQAAKYIQRRVLVASLLAEFPWCQRCHKARSSEVHELLSRARGGSILDRENCRALCHECHAWITSHPKQATEEGWLRSRFGGAA